MHAFSFKERLFFQYLIFNIIKILGLLLGQPESGIIDYF